MPSIYVNIKIEKEVHGKIWAGHRIKRVQILFFFFCNLFSNVELKRGEGEER